MPWHNLKVNLLNIKEDPYLISAEGVYRHILFFLSKFLSERKIIMFKFILKSLQDSKGYYPEVVSKIPADSDSLEIQVFGLREDEINKISDLNYSIEGKVFLDEADRVSKASGSILHVVTCTWHKFDPENGTINSDTRKILHVCDAYESYFNILVYVNSDGKLNLHHGSTKRVNKLAKRTGANCILEIGSSSILCSRSYPYAAPREHWCSLMHQISYYVTGYDITINESIASKTEYALKREVGSMYTAVEPKKKK